MHKIIFIAGLLTMGACADERLNSPEKRGDDAFSCYVHLKRTCVVPGETKCLAYATEDLSNCKEGK